jgi:hypothetical protein
MIVYVVQANYVWDESEVYHVQKIFENEEMANEYVKDQRSNIHRYNLYMQRYQEGKPGYRWDESRRLWEIWLSIKKKMARLDLMTGDELSELNDALEDEGYDRI